MASESEIHGEWIVDLEESLWWPLKSLWVRYHRWDSILTIAWIRWSMKSSFVHEYKQREWFNPYVWNDRRS